MKWSQKKTRFRSLIIMEFIVLALMMALVYGTNPATTSETKTEPGSNVWVALLLFLSGYFGLLFQIIGLIGLLIEKMWAKHFFSIGVATSAITSIAGKIGMAENWFRHYWHCAIGLWLAQSSH